MKQKLAHFMLQPFMLSLLNVMILILAYTALKFTWFELNPSDHFHDAVELWEGFGTILLGFGVLLEERSTLRKILVHDIKDSKKLDLACHDYGLFFVLLGVFIETFAWLVKIPNVVLDTYAVEYGLVQLAGIFAAAGVILQIRFFYRIHFKK